MISARELLQSLDRLSHPQRVRLIAGHARRIRGTEELGVLAGELAAGDSFSRDVAVFLATVAQDVPALRLFLDDADGTVRARAIKAWLLTGDVTRAEVARLIDDAPYAIRHAVYTQMRRKARGRRLPGLADALVDAVRARFGDTEAGRLLPACTPETAARLLARVGTGGNWNATVAAHPSAALAEARRQLAELPAASRTEWWSTVGVGVFGAPRTHTGEVMELLAEYAPATTLPGDPSMQARLVKAYPQRFVELMLDRRRAEWLRRARLSRSLLTALAVLPDERLIELAVRLREAGRLPELLIRLAPSRRAAIFDGAYAGVDRAQAVLPDALLAALPWRRRAAEARRMLALERTDTTAERVRLTAFLPWTEAEEALLAATRSPVADERAYAWENLVRCAGRSSDPAIVTQAAELLLRLRNEQDPVRSRALGALAAVPSRLVETAAVDTLTTIFADALAARDASMATRSAIQRVALGVLVTHAADATLVRPALLWLEALFGDDRLPYLGRLELRRGQEHEAFAAVRDWIANGLSRRKYALLIGFASALRKRAYHLPELQEMLRDTIRTGRPSTVVRQAVDLWLADPAHRDTRAEEVLRGDPSTITLSPVWTVVDARRTDLLDLVLGDAAPTGAFISKRTRWVPGYASHVRRWLPRQRERYVHLLSGVAADAGATIGTRSGAIRSAALVPELGWAVVSRWHDSSDVALAESALGAMPWTDRPADALPSLLRHTNTDRARVAIYAARRAARFVAPSVLGEAVEAALAEKIKVTSRKEITRLAADFSVPQAASLVYGEWRRPDAHRDVRAALIGVARLRLEQPYAWPILTEAAETGEYAAVVALAAAQPLWLPGNARPRYASLITTACRSGDPKAAEQAWTRVPAWAPWAADLGTTIIAGLLDLSPTGPARYAVLALTTVLRSGTGYATLDAALRQLIDLDLADLDDDPERDRTPLRRAHSVLSGVAGAVRDDATGFGLAALAAAARHAATHDPLTAEAAKLLVEATGEDELDEVCDLVADRPAAAAAIADLVRAAGVRRDWTREVAPRLAGRLRDRGDLAGGLVAVALTRLGAAVGFAEPYRGLVRSLRRHPLPAVRDAALEVILSTH